METITIHSLKDLPLAAEAILKHSGGAGVVAFYGEMGAGKTTLIREICSQLGVTDTVTSPTFAIVNQYLAGDEARDNNVSTDGEGIVAAERVGGGKPVYHFDFYRIEDLAEAFDMGYAEYFDSGDLCLVEWAEKIGPLIPEEALRVGIEITGPEGRVIIIDN